MPRSLCLDVCKQDWWVSVLDGLHSLSWLLLLKTGSGGHARTLCMAFYNLPASSLLPQFKRDLLRNHEVQNTVLGTGLVYPSE